MVLSDPASLSNKGGPFWARAPPPPALPCKALKNALKNALCRWPPSLQAAKSSAPPAPAILCRAPEAGRSGDRTSLFCKTLGHRLSGLSVRILITRHVGNE